MNKYWIFNGRCYRQEAYITSQCVENVISHSLIMLATTEKRHILYGDSCTSDIEEVQNGCAVQIIIHVVYCRV